ncbi:hypothetical protein H0H87_011158 [Tephrocybe sp. NHM501043]|nr:hypothetical protein H0H87_011158 [Tephrocybe sp. NHM501043]
MSNSNDRYFGTSYSKSHRSSPDHSQGFFPTGQGGRTVLPPISSAFPTSRFPVPYPNQYTPRSSPARYEVNPQVLYHYSPEPATSYPIYETHERYPTPSQSYNYTARTPPLPAAQPAENRKLPQLATNTGPGWSTTSYMPTTSNYQASGGIRSPTASYPGLYTYPTGNNYTYLPTPHDHGHIQIPSMNPSSYNTTSYECGETSRSDPHRSSSPYGRSSSHTLPPSTTPPPVSPTSPEESTIKKKRKRADARQLKVLNETYNRTAFPSTEERLALAKELDMTARSVQIWYATSFRDFRMPTVLIFDVRFQNKRQSMRQTNRQSSATGSSSQPFSMTGQDPLDELEPSVSYGNMATTEGQYSRHSPDLSRSSHASQSTSQRRVRHNEEPEHHRKWYN